jgi:radical SAM protein with 4Fe4S-binding SPASM domain
MGFSVRTALYKIITDKNHEKCLEKEISKDFFNAYFSSLGLEKVKKMHRWISEKQKVFQASDSFCNGLYTGITIDSNGIIFPCASFRKLPLGSVFDNKGIHELLTSSQALQDIRSLRRADLSGCDHCKFVDVCSFCLGMMHTRNQDVTIPLSQNCTYFKTLEALGGSD